MKGLYARARRGEIQQLHGDRRPVRAARAPGADARHPRSLTVDQCVGGGPGARGRRTADCRDDGPSRPARKPERAHPPGGVRQLQEPRACSGRSGRTAPSCSGWPARRSSGTCRFPLVHIDTSFKIPEMIDYRDRLAARVEPDHDLRPEPAGAARTSGPSPTARSTASPAAGCSRPRRSRRRSAASGPGTGSTTPSGPTSWTRTPSRTPASSSAPAPTRRAAARRSATSRPATAQSHWDVGDQPPEFWNQYKTEFAPGTHLRIHPLLDWTELNIWEYIERENIPTVSLYYNQGDGKRYRSLGCWPCTKPVESDAAQRGRDHRRAEDRQVRQHRRALGPGAGQGRRRRAGDPPARRVHVEPPCCPRRPSTPSRPSSRSPTTGATSRCASRTWPATEQIPPKFLELILLGLKNHGILQSRKGKGGGYLLARDPTDIYLGQIVRMFDGPLAPGPVRQPDGLRALRRLPERGGVRRAPRDEGGPGRHRSRAGRDQPRRPPPPSELAS